MNNQPLFSIEEKVRLATQVPKPSQQFTDALWKRIASTPARQPAPVSRFRQYFYRPIWALLAIFLMVAVGVAAAGPERVLAALQGLIGYVPGVGFVQDAETSRVLASPISVTKDGVTVTVEDVAVDSLSTRIKLHVTGIPNLQKLVESGPRENAGPSGASLPDGTKLKMKGGEYLYLPGGMSGTLIYDPLPSGIMDLALFFQQIPGIPPGTLPEDWSLHLPLIPGSQSKRMVASTSIEYNGQTVNGISIAIESIAQLEANTAIKVRLNFAPELGQPDENWPSALKVIDSEGHVVPFLNDHWNGPGFDPSDRAAVTLETAKLASGKSYTLILQGPIQLIQAVESGPGAQFSFDPGPDPNIGQSWTLDQTVEAAGVRLHLTGAHLYSNLFNLEDQYDLVFDIEKHPGLSGAIITPTDSTSFQRFGLREYSSETTQSWVELTALPKGEIRCQINQVVVPHDGLWEVNWTQP